MGLVNASRNNMRNVRKRLIIERGSICQKCSYPGYVEVHHIKPVSNGGLDNAENLVLLCEKCHADAHGMKKRNWLDPERISWTGVDK